MRRKRRIFDKRSKRTDMREFVAAFGRKSKYRAVATVVDNIRFHSKREAARYVELKMLEQAGQIHDLRLQPRYPLVVNGTSCGTYVGDFAYYWPVPGKDSIFRLEDVKGVKTAAYVLKRKLVKAIYGIDILETQ